MTTCSICNSDFDQEAEGGISGATFSLCPLCLSECDKMRPPVPCQRCGHLYDEDEDDA